MPMLSGLSGFDAESVVTQLMAIERNPIARLAARKKAEETRLTTLQSSRSLINNVRTAAQELTKASLWRSVSSSSSNTAAADVTVGGSPVSSTASFTVDSLATARELISNTSYASLSSVASTGVSTRTTGLSNPATTLGLSAITAASDLPDGSYSVAATASSASKLTGGALTASTSITNGSNTLILTNSYGTDSATGTLTIPNGTYTQQGLVDAINTAMSTATVTTTGSYTTLQASGQRPAGLGITASLVGSSIVLTSSFHGSASTISVDQTSSARTQLKLRTADSTATAGSVGSLSVNGQAVSLGTLLVPSTTLTSQSGKLSMTLGPNGLSAASTTLTVTTTTPTKSLSEMVAEINAGTDYTATAVSDGAGGYRLHVASSVTGAASTVDLSAFTIDGGMAVEHAGTDAQITLTGGTVKTSSTNVFTDVLTGSTLTVKALSASTIDTSVTVGSASVDTIASKLTTLVNALNTSLSDISRQTGYDSTTRKSGDLSRELGLRRAATDLRQALLGAGVSPSQYGISVDRTGTFSFDRSKLATAMAASPDGVQHNLVGPTGLITRLADVASSAAFGSTSTLGTAENTRRSTIRRYTADMDSMTSRLEKRETTLRAQFTQLEMSLQRLQGQSNWLTNQINSLNGASKN